MPIAHHLFVCANQKDEVGREVAKALKHEIKRQSVKSRLVDGEKHYVRVQTCSCLDVCKQCKKGPGAALVIYPEAVFYGNVCPKDAADIVGQHLGEGRLLKRLLIDAE